VVRWSDMCEVDRRWEAVELIREVVSESVKVRSSRALSRG